MYAIRSYYELFEVQKYISLTGHKYESTPLLASKMIFATLSKRNNFV